MKFPHTPGPWKASLSMSHEIGVFKNRHYIFSIEDKELEEAVANAYLAAMAPEMYQAISEASDLLCDHTDPNAIKARAVLDRVLDRLEAIRKERLGPEAYDIMRSEVI